MKLHLVSLPHTQVSAAFCGCAYTAKVLKFCKMLGSAHKILVYAPEGPPIEGATLVPCLTNEQRVAIFGADDPNRLPAWPSFADAAIFNHRAANAIRANAGPHDLVLLAGGLTHEAIIRALPKALCCEPFCGYEGILTDKVAFESNSHRHTVYALRGIIDGRWFDTVIPNFFDPTDFPHLNTGKGDYLLFLGRLIARKGVHVALQIAEACGLPLVVAGAGGKQVGNKIVASEFTLEGNVRYVGPVDIEKRAVLLAGAKALICPTIYVEPFGGVAVEAMMAGTPAITTNWGGFTETVKEGVSGFRFNSFAEACQAVARVGELDPTLIQQHALNNYSFNAVAPQFNRWFAQLQTLWGAGWYEVAHETIGSDPPPLSLLPSSIDKASSA